MTNSYTSTKLAADTCSIGTLYNDTDNQHKSQLDPHARKVQIGCVRGPSTGIVLCTALAVYVTAHNRPRTAKPPGQRALPWKNPQRTIRRREHGPPSQAEDIHGYLGNPQRRGASCSLIKAIGHIRSIMNIQQQAAI